MIFFLRSLSENWVAWEDESGNLIVRHANTSCTVQCVCVMSGLSGKFCTLKCWIYSLNGRKTLTQTTFRRFKTQLVDTLALLVDFFSLTLLCCCCFYCCYCYCCSYFSTCNCCWAWEKNKQSETLDISRVHYIKVKSRSSVFIKGKTGIEE